ncbi:MAG: dTMP kinase [Defluviitaleaceae bacterium]|nr:dTMP kinase [Defluviitaleaceae bacterium]
MKGLFITFEGSDGAGKTVQSQMLLEYFKSISVDAVLTREPGGTKISEIIRNIILDNNNLEMTDMTETLLYAAARAQHVGELIKPNLDAGKVVICDRFVDSSVAYQGFARGIGVDTVEDINNYATLGLKPDLTFFLDLEPKLGIKRKSMEKALDRMESEKLEFYEKVYNGYVNLSKMHSDRIIRIDASLQKEAIYGIIISKVKELL